MSASNSSSSVANTGHSNLDQKGRLLALAELQEMFRHCLDPEVVHLILTESDYNVDNALDTLFALSRESQSSKSLPGGAKMNSLDSFLEPHPVEQQHRKQGSPAKPKYCTHPSNSANNISPQKGTSKATQRNINQDAALSKSPIIYTAGQMDTHSSYNTGNLPVEFKGKRNRTTKEEFSAVTSPKHGNKSSGQTSDFFKDVITDGPSLSDWKTVMAKKDKMAVNLSRENQSSFKAIDNKDIPEVNNIKTKTEPCTGVDTQKLENQLPPWPDNFPQLDKKALLLSRDQMTPNITAPGQALHQPYMDPNAPYYPYPRVMVPFNRPWPGLPGPNVGRASGPPGSNIRPITPPPGMRGIMGPGGSNNQWGINQVPYMAGTRPHYDASSQHKMNPQAKSFQSFSVTPNIQGHLSQTQQPKGQSSVLGVPQGKALVLMRGLPGSGKTFLAMKLKAKGVVYSTDQFFVSNGSKYEFDFAKLGEAHEWNQLRARKSMEEGVTPVIIDNTNTTTWEMRPYVSMAQRLGYNVIFKEPTTPWKWNPKELARRNIHGVSLEKIRDMLERYEHDMTISKIFNKRDKKEDENKTESEDSKSTIPENKEFGKITASPGKIPSGTASKISPEPSSENLGAGNKGASPKSSSKSKPNQKVTNKHPRLGSPNKGEKQGKQSGEASTCRALETRKITGSPNKQSERKPSKGTVSKTKAAKTSPSSSYKRELSHGSRSPVEFMNHSELVLALVGGEDSGVGDKVSEDDSVSITCSEDCAQPKPQRAPRTRRRKAEEDVAEGATLTDTSVDVLARDGVSSVEKLVTEKQIPEDESTRAGFSEDESSMTGGDQEDSSSPKPKEQRVRKTRRRGAQGAMSCSALTKVDDADRLSSSEDNEDEDIQQLSVSHKTVTKQTRENYPVINFDGFSGQTKVGLVSDGESSPDVYVEEESSSDDSEISYHLRSGVDGKEREEEEVEVGGDEGCLKQQEGGFVGEAEVETLKGKDMESRDDHGAADVEEEVYLDEEDVVDLDDLKEPKKEARGEDEDEVIQIDDEVIIEEGEDEMNQCSIKKDTTSESSSDSTDEVYDSDVSDNADSVSEDFLSKDEVEPPEHLGEEARNDVLPIEKTDQFLFFQESSSASEDVTSRSYNPSEQSESVTESTSEIDESSYVGDTPGSFTLTSLSNLLTAIKLGKPSVIEESQYSSTDTSSETTERPDAFGMGVTPHAGAIGTRIKKIDYTTGLVSYEESSSEEQELGEELHHVRDHTHELVTLPTDKPGRKSDREQGHEESMSGLEFMETCFPDADTTVIRSILSKHKGDVNKAVQEMLNSLESDEETSSAESSEITRTLPVRHDGLSSRNVNDSFALHSEVPSFPDTSRLIGQQTLEAAAMHHASFEQQGRQDSQLNLVELQEKQEHRLDLTASDQGLQDYHPTSTPPERSTQTVEQGHEDHQARRASPETGEFQMSLEPAVAYHLLEMFGTVAGIGLESGLNPEDMIVNVGRDFARALYNEWRKTVEKRKGIERKDSSVRSTPGSARKHKKRKKRTAFVAQSQRATPITMGAGFTESPTPSVSNLREIMNEQLAVERSRSDLDKRDSDSNMAVVLKRQKLYAMFPGVDPVALEELFQANCYELAPTVHMVQASCNLQARPVTALQATSGSEDNQEDWSWLCLDDAIPGGGEARYQATDAPDYTDFRAEAATHYKLRDECFKKAALAFSKKQGQLAQFYANQGRLHTEKINQANDRAAAMILEHKNSDQNQYSLDLHGLHVNEALQALQEKLNPSDPSKRRPKYITVVTGRGIHSRGGRAKIKPAVLEYLQQNGYRHEELHPGGIRVFLK